MKRTANKILALLVLAAMVVSIVPVHAFATADDPIVNDGIVVEPAQSEDEHTEPADETPQQEIPEDTAAGDSVSENIDQPETVPDDQKEEVAEPTETEVPVTEEPVTEGEEDAEQNEVPDPPEDEPTEEKPVPESTKAPSEPEEEEPEEDPQDILEENKEYVEEVLEDNASKEKDPDAAPWTIDENGNAVLADEYKVAQTTLVRVRSNGQNNHFHVYKNGEFMGEFFYFAGTVYGSVLGGKTEYYVGDENGLIIGTAARGDVISVESNTPYNSFSVIRDLQPGSEDPLGIVVGQEFDITLDLTYPARLRAPALRAGGSRASGADAEAIFENEASFKAWLDSIVPEFIDVNWTVVSIDGYDENIGGVWRFQVNIARIEMDYNGRHIVFTSTGPGTQVSAMCGQMGQGVPPGPVGDSGTGQIYRERYDSDNVAAFKALYQQGYESVNIGYWFRFYRPYQDLVCIQAITYKVNFPRNGTLKLTKESTNPSLTNGNDCYSLEGATFEVYDSGNAKVATIVVNANGEADTVELPAGTYTVKETKAGKGYKLDTAPQTVTITTGEEATVTIKNQPDNDPSSVVIYKIDPNTGERSPQGNGTLGGAQFTVKYYDNYDHSGTPTRTWVYETNDSGYFDMHVASFLKSGTLYTNNSGAVVMPLGSYTVQETKAPTGYRLNNVLLTATVKMGSDNKAHWAWDGTFSGAISQQSDGTNFKEASVIRGGVKFIKLNAENDEPVAGAEITIYNNSGNSVVVDGKTIANGAAALTITSGSDGIAKTANDALPYGNYYAKETKAPSGYSLNREWRVDFTITENGSLLDRTIGVNQLKDAPMRADLKMLKVDESGEPMANVPFWIVRFDTKGAEAERHVIVTDENGYLDTGASARSHLNNTNGLDQYVDDGVFTDTSKLDPTTGVWFGSDTPDNAKGALPCGKYQIIEIQTENTKGIDLLQTPVIDVLEDGAVVEVDNMTNLNVVLDSVALDDSTGTHMMRAGAEMSMHDTVSYGKLTPDGKYALLTQFVSREDVADVLAETEQEFTAEAASGEVTNTVTLDTTEYEGKAIVAVDYLYQYIDGNKILIAEHVDLTDEDQMLHVGKISTTAADGYTEDHVGTVTEKGSIVDTIEYEGLIAGQEYRFVGTLIDAGTEEQIGETVEKTVTIEEENGTAVMPAFEFDTTEYAGKTVVVFEELYLITGEGEEVKVNEHESIDDGDQTIEFPEVHTTASDRNTEDHIGTVSEESVILDKVEVRNLIVGQEYTVTGRLVYKTDFTDEDGVSRKAGDEVGILEGSVTEKTFTAEESEMTIELEYHVDSRLLRGTTAVVFEDLMHNGVVVAAHSDLEDKEQSISYPKIKTQALDRTSGTSFVTRGPEVIFKDTVAYSGLVPGRAYILKGSLTDRESGEPLGCSAESERFTPAEPDGTYTMEFVMDTEELPSGTIVVFEDLYLAEGYTETLILEHHDPDDTAQSLYIPDLKTGAAAADTGTRETQAREMITVVDEVVYSDLRAGEEYTVTGTVMDKTSGEPVRMNGRDVTASITFIAEDTCGSVHLSFDLPAEKLAGKTVVVFESLLYKGRELAVHADIEDEAQSVNILDIRTKAKDAKNGTQNASVGTTVELIDTVSYTGLTPGKTYTLYGTIMVKGNKTELRQNGAAVAGLTEFVPASPDGSAEVSFVVNTADIQGYTLVVFEELYAGSMISDTLESQVPVASHMNWDDTDQTIGIPVIHVPRTGDETNPGLLFALASGSGAGLLLLLKKRKEN